MTMHEYAASRDLSRRDPPFYGLIMAAMRAADSENIARLAEAFPDVYAEFAARYNAPTGCLTVTEWVTMHHRRCPRSVREAIDTFSDVAATLGLEENLAVIGEQAP